MKRVMVQHADGRQEFDQSWVNAMHDKVSARWSTDEQRGTWKQEAEQQAEQLAAEKMADYDLFRADQFADWLDWQWSIGHIS